MPRPRAVQILYYVAAGASLLAGILHARNGDSVRAGGSLALAGGLLMLAGEIDNPGMTRRRAAAYVLILVALGLLFARMLT